MTTIRTNVEFGKEYKDSNSGFCGKAICIAKWQYGCVRVTLQPPVGEDGKLPEAETFDESALISGVDDPGGPMPNPKQNPNPKR